MEFSDSAVNPLPQELGFIINRTLAGLATHQALQSCAKRDGHRGSPPLTAARHARLDGDLSCTSRR